MSFSGSITDLDDSRRVSFLAAQAKSERDDRLNCPRQPEVTRAFLVSY